MFRKKLQLNNDIKSCFLCILHFLGFDKIFLQVFVCLEKNYYLKCSILFKILLPIRIRCTCIVMIDNVSALEHFHDY